MQLSKHYKHPPFTPSHTPSLHASMGKKLKMKTQCFLCIQVKTRRQIGSCFPPLCHLRLLVLFLPLDVFVVVLRLLRRLLLVHLLLRLLLERHEGKPVANVRHVGHAERRAGPEQHLGLRLVNRVVREPRHALAGPAADLRNRCAAERHPPKLPLSHIIAHGPAPL